MSWFAKAGLRVLMYHKVVDGEKSPLVVSLDQFKKQIKYLEENNFVFLSWSQVLNHLENKIPFSKKSILLTFDDGYRSNAGFAFPFLLAKKIKPLLFIASDYVGRKSSWDPHAAEIFSVDELKRWQDQGVDLGFHSHAHRSYTDLTIAEIENDLVEGKRALSRTGLVVVPALAYPYGACPHKDTEKMAQLESLLARNHFKMAFRIGNRVNANMLSPFLLQRIDVRGDHSWLSFIKNVNFGRIL